METNIDLIRIALAEGATTEARENGANACRAVLATLESQPAPPTPAPRVDQPLVPPSAGPRLDPAQIASLATTIRGVPMEQLLDLAIAKLRTMTPRASVPVAPAFSIPFVPVPRQ